MCLSALTYLPTVDICLSSIYVTIRPSVSVYLPNLSVYNATSNAATLRTLYPVSCRATAHCCSATQTNVSIKDYRRTTPIFAIVINFREHVRRHPQSLFFFTPSIFGLFRVIAVCGDRRVNPRAAAPWSTQPSRLSFLTCNVLKIATSGNRVRKLERNKKRRRK